MTPREGLPITLAQLRAEFETDRVAASRPREIDEQLGESRLEGPLRGPVSGSRANG